MDEVRFNALKESIIKFGFIVPVITNKDLVIADGEHRTKAAKQLGLEKIPVLTLPVKEIDRRLLRQVMNKLRGEHDLDLDLVEYAFLKEYNAMDQLEQFLPEFNYDILLESIGQSPLLQGEIKNMDRINNLDAQQLEKMNKSLEGFAAGKIRLITLYFSNEEYTSIMPRILSIIDQVNVKNTTELFLHFLGEYEKNNPSSEEA